MSIYRNQKPTDTACGWDKCRDVCEEGLGVCRAHALQAYAWVLGNVEIPTTVKSQTRKGPSRPTPDAPNPPRKRSPMKMTPGLIYAIETDGAIKIGFTTNYRERMGELRPDRHLGVMPGTMYEEGDLHRRFERHRIRGEWFKPSREIRAFIRDNMKPYESQAA